MLLQQRLHHACFQCCLYAPVFALPTDSAQAQFWLKASWLCWCIPKRVLCCRLNPKDIGLLLPIHSMLIIQCIHLVTPSTSCIVQLQLKLCTQVQVSLHDHRMQNKEKEEAKANKDTKAALDSSTQAADAPTSASPSSPTPKPSPTQALQTATAQRAQRFQKQYFTGSSSCSGAQTDGMRQLSSICSQLASPGKVQELLSLLQDQESANISTFEFLTSGAVHQLREYLAGSDLMKGKSRVHVDSQKLLQRPACLLGSCYGSGQGWNPSYANSGRSHPLCQYQSCTVLPCQTSVSLLACMASPSITVTSAATSSRYSILKLC